MTKISWINIPDRIKYELQQRHEEGSNPAEFREEWERINSLVLNETDFHAAADQFYSTVESSRAQAVNAANEPSTWHEIIQLCQRTDDVVPIVTSEEIMDRILGGWMGRSAGCLLGKPIEKISRAGSIELLSSNGTWPITDYITAKGIPDVLLKKYPWNRHYGKESLKENIVCMTEDDDMNYPMMNLYIAEFYGSLFTSGEVVTTWMEMAPVLTTFTAERVAYYNALNGLVPPETAMTRNPYREWIGAQIRADLWGWISPGQPMRAAEFAWRDAAVSHVRNGMYGEMFFAAAVAASFTHSTIEDVIRQALRVIPPQSRLSDAINFVLSIPIREQTWDKTVEVIYKQFGDYHWVHTINNAALVVAALLSAKGNYETAICNVVMGGWDTDSNGATVGSIMGTMLGRKNLPNKWIEPLHDRIRSSLKGFDNASLSSLANRTVSLANYTSR
jgi:ADP-ribosylglycohydrolase